MSATAAGRVDTWQLWLPPLAHFAAAGPLRSWLLRADQLTAGRSGYVGGLGDYFPSVATALPAAALIRQQVVGDAGDALWLAADPAWARADINGIRLMACGHMQLDLAQAQALAEPLLPLFAEAGMQLLVSSPDQWQVRLAPGEVLPPLSAPEQALGEDMAEHLPQDAAGKRWRLLLNDIQVALHQHPINQARRARGLPPVNTLWLWGAGRLPKRAAAAVVGVLSDDLLVNALATHAGVAAQPRMSDGLQAAASGWLLDLQDLPAAVVEDHWWPQLLQRCQREPMTLHFASGERWLRQPWHRWRWWRRAGK